MATYSTLNINHTQGLDCAETDIADTNTKEIEALQTIIVVMQRVEGRYIF